MIKRIALSLIAATLALVSVGASAAVVSGKFNIDSSALLDLYSGTLDPACDNTGTFFCGNLPAQRAVSIANVGTGGPGGGLLQVQYDDATGEITQVDALILTLPDLDITITTASLGNGFAQVIQGNGMPAANDVPTVVAGNDGSFGSADADQAAGNVSVFQHDAGGDTDATGFSSFPDIVDSCVGTSMGSTVCFLIPALNINAVRYQLDGTINAGGITNLTLTSETSNNSRYIVDFSATIVPVPAAVWLFGSALGLLGWMRRRSV